jgi:alkanesulfonate monooxygenase SsuD/methylene tetrahydromethanopterin reductase-like flavin-dependent oxidoreductase (luciferase family)
LPIFVSTSPLLPLLRGEAIDRHGEFFDVHLEAGMGRPQCPPVLIAALGPQMLRIPGALADGTGLTITGPRYLEERVVPTLSRAADAASRDHSVSPSPHPSR